LKRHGQASIFDVLSLAAEDPSLTNIALVDCAIKSGHASTEELKAIRAKLQSYLGIKAKYWETKANLREEYLKKVAKGDESQIAEHREMVNLRFKYEAAFNKDPVKDDEYNTFVNSLETIVNNQVKAVVNDFSQYEIASNERQRFYFHFTRESTSEALDTFRTDLLQHLAGSIVVKEHRLRYQKEQFDRFICSMHTNQLFKKNQTLREFCRSYANMIEVLVEDSFNDKSPKIEANYDNFTE
jgi:hypothetical protein